MVQAKNNSQDNIRRSCEYAHQARSDPKRDKALWTKEQSDIVL